MMNEENLSESPYFSDSFEIDVPPLSPIDNEDVDNESLLKQEKLKRYKDNSKIRKWLSIWVVIVISLWLLGVMVSVFLLGSGVFSFSSSVFIALLSTTTANVLGLAFILLQGMFLKRKR